MYRHIAMSLLKSVIFSDIMQIITSNDNGSLHFHLLNDSGQDTSANGNVSSERAFFVNVGAFDGLIRINKNKYNRSNYKNKQYNYPGWTSIRAAIFI